LHRVPIFDALILYQCPYTGTISILVARNELYVPSLEHNPIVMRQARLRLSEVFSVLELRKPTLDVVLNDDFIIVPIFAKKATWDPTSNIFEFNTMKMLMWRWTEMQTCKRIRTYRTYIVQVESIVENIKLATMMANYSLDLRRFDEVLVEEMSSKFSEFEAKCVSATIDNSVLCNGLVEVPEWLGFSPDQVHESDVTLILLP